MKMGVLVEPDQCNRGNISLMNIYVMLFYVLGRDLFDVQ